MSDIEYELKYPITVRSRTSGGPVQEETITDVRVRRIKARDLQGLDKHSGQMSQSLYLIGQLCGLLPAQVSELDAEDIQGLGEIIGDFFPKSSGTGENS